MLAKYAITGLVCAPWNQIQRIKDVRLYAQIVIKTVNIVISRCCFAENGTHLFKRACRTCSRLIFPHSTNQILYLWRCRYRCRCRSRCRWSSLLYSTRVHWIILIINLCTESEVTSLCIKWIHCHVHNAGNVEDSWKQKSNVSIELHLYLVIQNVFPTRKQWNHAGI